MIEHTLGVVLVGGASTRMGKDKASIRFGGSTLLERSVAVASTVFASVVVSGGDYAPVGASVVADLVPGLGPLGGLDSAFRVAKGRNVFLLAVDMPFVDATTVRRIADPEVVSMSARVPVAAGRIQPLCAVYGSGLGPLVRDRVEGKDRSMENLLAAVDVEELLGIDDAVFVNVNTQADLQDALRRSGRHRSTR